MQTGYLTTRKGGSSFSPLLHSGLGRLVDRVSFELVYDGSSLSEHQMDVRDLVPALTGIGDLIRDANLLVNKDLAEVRVFVNSEHKPACFSISFELWQSLYETAKGLLGSDGVRTAKEILEWLDLYRNTIGGGTAALGVLGYYRWRRGRKLATVQTVHDAGPGGVVQVKVEGDNNTVLIPRVVYDLAHNRKIAKDTTKLLDPLKKDGIDVLESRVGDESSLEVSKEDAKDIVATCALVKDEEDILSINVIVAHLTPYDARFDPDAKQWEFWHGDKRIQVDISESSIARDAVNRRSVSMDDIYKVDLEITERKTSGGQIRTDYKVLNVHDRFPGPKQDKLFDPPDDNSDS